MSVVNLKKLVFRKELALIHDLITAIDPNVVVQTPEGHVLYGSYDLSFEYRHPIQMAEQILGWVQGGEKAQSIAHLLAHLASREMEKRTLAQELLGKYKEISLLFNLSEKLVESFDIQEVSRITLAEACRMLHSDHGAIFLADDNINCLPQIATFGTHNTLPQSIELGQSILGNIISIGRGEIINDVRSNCRSSSANSAGPAGITSLICVPLKQKDSLLGAIVLSRSQQQPYTAEDLKLLTTLACQTTGIIGALFHERKLTESRQNDLIFRLSSQIRDSLELSSILDTAVHEIRLALNIDRCFFAWCDLNEHQLDAPWTADKNTGLSSGLPEALPARRSIQYIHLVSESRASHLPSLLGDYDPANLGSIALKLMRYEWVQIDDSRATADPSLRRFLQNHQFTSLLAIPIQTNTGRLGIIGCSTTQEIHPWSKDEIVLLSAVTTQLAIALDQAELYHQRRLTAQVAQEKASELEATLQQLQQAQLHLIQSEKLSSLGQMVAGIAHEINNPVNFIHGNLPYLSEYIQDLTQLISSYQEAYPNPVPKIQAQLENLDLDFVLRDLQKVQTSMALGTNRIRDIVLSMRNFSRLDEAQFKTVNLHDGIDSTLLMLEHRLKPVAPFPGIQLTKHYGDLPEIECYAGQLNQVFMNLLGNAIDALEEASQLSNASQRLPLTIDIYTQSIDPHTVEIRIRDNGPGIPKTIQSKLFDPFFTTKAVGKGTGLGLSISYQIIVERHQGSLDCRSNSGGTEFIILLPIQQRLPVSAHALLSPERPMESYGLKAPHPIP